jgi:ribosomal protein S3AE
LRKSPVKTSKDYLRSASGRRTTQEIDAIRDVLKRRGYRIRKQARQAAWTVYVTDDKCYLLTYQPAPVRAWVLHPQDNDIRYKTLCNIIQRTVTKKSPKSSRRHS